MNPPPPRPANKIGRKRRAAGWTLLALGVLVAGVWVASGWWLVQWGWQHGDGHLLASIRRGAVSALFEDPVPVPRPVGLLRDRTRHPSWEWQWHYSYFQYKKMRHLDFQFSLWPGACAPVIMAALLLRSGILARRRAMTGTCTKCGYSLAGLANDATCPECGKGAAST